MKSRSLSLALTVVGLLILTGAPARAVTPASPVGFIFTANPGEVDYYNNSTVYFDPLTDTVVNWKMLDSANGVTLTPGANSYLGPATLITSASAADWTGVFYIYSDPFLPNDVFFRGANHDASFGDSLTAFGDPPGVWRPIGAAGVPDSGTTLQMFTLAFGGLALGRRWLCKQGA